MAEPKKESGAAKSNKKDEDIGNEFLSSWKSMSVIEDDPMDFGFDTVPNGKKKAFNFESLDMDFNLDGDFDKFSSFKMDMPDIDFSSSSKKTTKAKEKSEEGSISNKQGKKNHFDFSFNFNELDDFDFESSVKKKGDTNSSKNLNAKVVASHTNEDEGPKVLSAEVNDDNIITTFAAAESVPKSKLEKLVESSESSMSTHDTRLLSPSRPVSTSPGKIRTPITDEVDQLSPPITDKMTSTESQDAMQMTYNLPVQSVHEDGSNGDTTSDTRVEVNRSLVAEENVDKKTVAFVVSNHENMLPNDLLHNTEPEESKCEQNESGGKSQTEKMDEIESTQADLEDTLMAGLSGKTPQETCGNHNIQSNQTVNDLTPTEEKIRGASHAQILRKSEETRISNYSTHPQVTLSIKDGSTQLCPANKNSDQTVDDLTTSEKKIEVSHSLFLNRPNETGTRILRSSAQQLFTSGNKNIGSTHLRSANQNSKQGVIRLTPTEDKTKGASHSKSEESGAQIPHSLGYPQGSPGNKIISTTHLSPANEISAQALSNLALAEEKETEAIRSRYIKETVPQVNYSLAQLNVVSIGPKAIGSTLSSTAKGKRPINTQPVSKSVKNLNSLSQELCKGQPGLIDTKNKATNPSDGRKGFNAEGIPNEAKLIGYPKPQLANKGEIIMSQSEKVSGSRAILSCLNEKPTKVLAPSMESMKSKILSADRLKAGMRMPSLSSLQNLRTMGTKIEKEAPSSSMLQQGAKSKRKLDLVVAGSKTSTIAHPVGRTESSLPQTPSLKRKNSEELNEDRASFKVLKSFSTSPIGIRRSKEPSETVVEEKVLYQETPTVSKIENVRVHPTSPVEIPHEEKMKYMELSFVMENNDNVEKAEAYTKELDDICNMLKKKHEEAKEVLVRAIVNNNILLMLNHPMYEEKIRMVSKFAELLLSKELPK